MATIPKWQKGLTKAERKHIQEVAGPTLRVFKGNLSQHRKMRAANLVKYGDDATLAEPCWECRAIARKLLERGVLTDTEAALIEEPAPAGWFCSEAPEKPSPSSFCKKDVQVAMAGNRLAVFVNGNFDRAYKVKKTEGMITEEWREGICCSLEFAGLIPNKQSLASFPWLHDYFVKPWHREYGKGCQGGWYCTEAPLEDERPQACPWCGKYHSQHETCADQAPVDTGPGGTSYESLVEAVAKAINFYQASVRGSELALSVDTFTQKARVYLGLGSCHHSVLVEGIYSVFNEGATKGARVAHDVNGCTYIAIELPQLPEGFVYTPGCCDGCEQGQDCGGDNHGCRDYQNWLRWTETCPDGYADSFWQQVKEWREDKPPWAPPEDHPCKDCIEAGPDCEKICNKFLDWKAEKKQRAHEALVADTLAEKLQALREHCAGQLDDASQALRSASYRDLENSQELAQVNLKIVKHEAALIALKKERASLRIREQRINRSLSYQRSRVETLELLGKVDTEDRGGREILFERPVNLSHKDHHLSWVLARYNGQYVTWMHNSDDGGFYHGHYFAGLEDAEDDFKNRG